MEFVEKLFDAPGSKLRMLAKIAFWVIAVIGIIGALAVLVSITKTSNFFFGLIVGVLYAALMVLVAWLSTLSMYALGTLIDDVSAIRKVAEKKED